MFPILNPPLSSLPVPSLWVVPVHQPQAPSIASTPFLIAKSLSALASERSCFLYNHHPVDYYSSFRTRLVSSFQETFLDCPSLRPDVSSLDFCSPGHGSFVSQYLFQHVTQSCLTLCDPMNRSTRGLPVHHQLPEFIQTHTH